MKTLYNNIPKHPGYEIVISKISDIDYAYKIAYTIAMAELFTGLIANNLTIKDASLLTNYVQSTITRLN